MGDTLTTDERQQLLAIARSSIESTLSDLHPTPPETILTALQAKHGCFVSLKKVGALRGCIGSFTSDRPLFRLVREMAAAAATNDPRFYPVRASELSELTIEISVLSPMKKIDDIAEIQVGTHGIYLEKNFCRGVLLPQVATEYGWDRETFLAQTCIKAGLGPNEWKDSSNIYIFSAEVFGEK